MVEKTANFTTIMVSIVTHEKLHRLKQQISEIVHREVSLGDVIQILLAVKDLDTQLSELIIA